MTLKEARRRAGLSQCQLAALAGVTQSMICKIRSMELFHMMHKIRMREGGNNCALCMQ